MEGFAFLIAVVTFVMALIALHRTSKLQTANFKLRQDLDRLKAEIDITAFIQAKGIELNPHGTDDLIGRCPAVARGRDGRGAAARCVAAGDVASIRRGTPRPASTAFASAPRASRARMTSTSSYSSAFCR